MGRVAWASFWRGLSIQLFRLLLHLDRMVSRNERDGLVDLSVVLHHHTDHRLPGLRVLLIGLFIQRQRSSCFRSWFFTKKPCPETASAGMSRRWRNRARVLVAGARGCRLVATYGRCGNAHLLQIPDCRFRGTLAVKYRDYVFSHDCSLSNEGAVRQNGDTRRALLQLLGESHVDFADVGSGMHRAR